MQVALLPSYMYIIHSEVGDKKSGLHIDQKIKIDTTNDVDVVGL